MRPNHIQAAWLCLAPVMLGLTACGAQFIPQLTPTFTPKFIMGDFCRMDHPMTYATQDADATKQQIEKHNTSWLCTCQGICADSHG